MEDQLNTQALISVRSDKVQELEAQQINLKKLQGELERINLKIKNKEVLHPDDVAYLSQLGWLSALAVTIASIAVF